MEEADPEQVVYTDLRASGGSMDPTRALEDGTVLDPKDGALGSEGTGLAVSSYALPLSQELDGVSMASSELDVRASSQFLLPSEENGAFPPDAAIPGDEEVTGAAGPPDLPLDDIDPPEPPLILSPSPHISAAHPSGAFSRAGVDGGRLEEEDPFAALGGIGGLGALDAGVDRDAIFTGALRDLRESKRHMAARYTDGLLNMREYYESELEAARSRVAEDMTSKQRREHDSSRALMTLQEEAAAAEGEAAALRVSLAAQERRLAEQDVVAIEARTEAEASTRQVRHLQEEAHRERMEREAAQAELRALRAEAAGAWEAGHRAAKEARQAADAAGREAAEREEALLRKAEEVARVGAQASEETRASLAKREVELADARRRAEAAEGEISRLRAELARARDDAEAARGAADEERRRGEQAEHSLAQASAQADHAKRGGLDAQTRLERAESRATHLQGVVEDMRAEAGEQARARHASEAQVEALHRETSVLRGRAAAAETELARLQRDHAAARADVSELERALSHANAIAAGGGAAPPPPARSLPSPPSPQPQLKAPAQLSARGPGPLDAPPPWDRGSSPGSRIDIPSPNNGGGSGGGRGGGEGGWSGGGGGGGGGGTGGGGSPGRRASPYGLDRPPTPDQRPQSSARPRTPQGNDFSNPPPPPPQHHTSHRAPAVVPASAQAPWGAVQEREPPRPRTAPAVQKSPDADGRVAGMRSTEIHHDRWSPDAMRGGGRASGGALAMLVGGGEQEAGVRGGRGHAGGGDSGGMGAPAGMRSDHGRATRDSWGGPFAPSGGHGGEGGGGGGRKAVPARPPAPFGTEPPAPDGRPRSSAVSVAPSHHQPPSQMERVAEPPRAGQASPPRRQPEPEPLPPPPPPPPPVAREERPGPGPGDYARVPGPAPPPPVHENPAGMRAAGRPGAGGGSGLSLAASERAGGAPPWAEHPSRAPAAFGAGAFGDIRGPPPVEEPPRPSPPLPGPGGRGAPSFTEMSVPYATAGKMQEMIQSTSQLEGRLMELSLERTQLESEYAKMPASSGRTLQERRRKQAVENRLEELGKEVSGVRMKLRELCVI